MCEYFINHPLEVVCKHFPQSIIYYYINYILLAASETYTLEKCLMWYKKVYPGGDYKFLLKEKDKEEIFLTI